MTADNNSDYEVKPFDQLLEDIGYSNQALYIYNYLNGLGVKSYVIENKYIDKDFIVDFSNFYSRSFDVDLKSTKRIHFFAKDILADYLKDLIENYTPNECKSLNDLYLGFVIVRPIQDFRGNPCLGRTLIKTYPLKDKNDHYCYLTQKYDVSLFGLPLSVETLPFLPQDSAVGACATSACWVSLHPLHNLFGVQKYSPYEITELAVTFPNEDRNFPSPGLTVIQMKSQFNSLGIDTEFITTKKTKTSCPLYKDSDDVIADAVKAYNHLGLPIIATLKIAYKDKRVEYHAVVISGYSHCNGIVTGIYIHDDQIGPFHRVNSDGNFSQWKNKWTDDGCRFVKVVELIVPIYQKMRLNFGLIYPIYIKTKRSMEAASNIYSKDATVDLFLTNVNDYKKYLLEHKFFNKLKILQTPMPRFLWIIRQRTNNQLSCDIVYDATAVYPKEFISIKYDIN